MSPTLLFQEKCQTWIELKMADPLQKLKRLDRPRIIIGISVIVVLLVSKLYVILALAAFVCGLLICKSIFTTNTILPNLLRFYTRQKPLGVQADELTLLKKICPVCGQRNCGRHRPELNVVALQPWTNLFLPGKIDEALEEFLNLVLKEFIYTWYRDLSEDEAFVDEIRSSLRFVACVLLRRVKKVDVPSLVLNNILKIAIRHLHFYLQVKRKGFRKDLELQEAVLEFYGAHLHCAMRSRKSELDYLRATLDRVFPYVLPPKSLNCKSLRTLVKEIVAVAILLPLLDKLADPDIVNNILLLFFDKDPAPKAEEPESEGNLTLEKFAYSHCRNTSCLHLGLSDILADPEILFPFMQFMKSEASVNVLQFYLSVEELNRKILTPELTQDQMAELHKELSRLYYSYCDPSAVDKISFDKDVVESLKQVAEGPPEGILKLQTSTPLFRAHDHACNLLEKTFVPLFHQSDDYYKMLCGERLPTKLTRTDRRSMKKIDDNLTLSKLSNKLKGVFKTPLVEEGKLINYDDIEYAEETEEDTAAIALNPRILNEGPRIVLNPWINNGPKHDLSAWRVTIPEITSHPEPDNTRKFFHAFNIDIRRVDVLENDFEASNWTVDRKYNEFHILEQKLKEFHGDMEDCQLPVRKTFGTKSKEFLESRRTAFEQYLQKLLTIPTLKGSELLYSFLTSRHEFTTNFLADINLGKMVRSGAMKLVKERGQHLEPFLHSFLQSCNTNKPRPGKGDSDSDTISISSEKMANLLYENNANREGDLSPATPVVLKPGFEYPVDGVMDAIVYLAEHVFLAPAIVMQVLLLLRMMFKSTMDSYVDWLLGWKLQDLAQEHRVMPIIHLIRDLLFYDTDPPRTDDEKRARRDKAFEELQHFIPKIFAQSIGEKNHQEGSKLIFEALQHPKLNKQLTYMLLDSLLADLFPEVCADDDSEPPRFLQGLKH